MSFLKKGNRQLDQAKRQKKQKTESLMKTLETIVKRMYQYLISVK